MEVRGLSVGFLSCRHCASLAVESQTAILLIPAVVHVSSVDPSTKLPLRLRKEAGEL